MVNAERKGKLRNPLKPGENQSTSEFLTKLLGKEDLTSVKQEDVDKVVDAESVADTILPRIKYRKSVGISNQNKAPIIILKGKGEED